jgi:hypothetical protein
MSLVERTVPDVGKAPEVGASNTPWSSSPARQDAARKAVIALAVLVMAVRLFLFIRRYAVNILFWDQWDFWRGMFEGADWWTLFAWEHGPQREGLGYVVIKLTALASGWDVKAEAYVIGALFVGSCLLALAIVRRLSGGWSFFDVCVPLVVLTVGNVEAYAGTTNPSHGPVPLLIILAIVLARLLEPSAVRAALTVLLNFFVVFTGFGLLFGPIVSFLLLLDLAAAVQRRSGVAVQALALCGSLGTLALFFRGFVFDSATACFVFPDPHPAQYPRYVAGMLMRVLQLHDLPHGRAPLGVCLVFAAVALVAWAGWHTVRSLGESRRHGAVFALSAFAGLFILNSAVGRVCLGEAQSFSSRYVSYTLLMLFAAYLAIRTSSLPASTGTALLALCLFVFVVKEARTKRTLEEARTYARWKQGWKDCYLEKLDVKACNRLATPVYPDETGTHIAAQLIYLREHHLNLFKKGG